MRYPRVVSLDFQRGIAICLMVVLHTFEHLYDYSWAIADPQRALTLPPAVLAVGGVAAYVGSWNAYFLLISATVNALAMTRRMGDGVRARVALGRQVLTGVGLLLLGVVVGSFMYDGYIGMALRTGDWGNTRPLRHGIFSMGTLHMIGWSTLINGVVHVLLMRAGGHRRTRTNILVFACLALAVVIASPFLHQWVDGMDWRVPDVAPAEFKLGEHKTWPSAHVQEFNASPRAWLFATLAGDLEPLFPYLATSFVGSIIGLALADRAEHRRLLTIGSCAAAGAIVVGAVFALSGSFTPGNNRPPIGNYLLMLGGQVGAMMLMLWLVEFRGDPMRFANRPLVRGLRLWSMASLSIFSLEILQLPLRWVFGAAAGLAMGQPVNMMRHGFFGYGQEALAFLVALGVVLCFHVLVKLWSRANFKYGFEWAIVRLASLGSGRVSTRLDVERLMNNTEWMRAGEPAAATAPATHRL
jgi:hypothetical protein